MRVRLLGRGRVFLVMVCLGLGGLGLWGLFGQMGGGKGLPTVFVYTYSSFMSVYGPGPEIKREFEKSCGCRVEFVNAGDSGLILQRLKVLTGADVDLVVGVDQFGFDEALRDHEWLTIDLGGVKWVEAVKPFVQGELIPFDWAPMTFIHKMGDGGKKISTIADIVESEDFNKSISLQDPRVSTPGLQFLFWMSQFGDGQIEKTWDRLRSKVHSVSLSWSNSYGLFKRGEAKLTFSYLTSPLYHWIVEKDMKYQPMVLDGGHPYQVEFFGIPERCQQCDLAKELAAFLLTPQAQKLLAEKNYMLPVVDGVALAEEFSNLPKVKLLSRKSMQEFIKHKKSLVNRWVDSYRDGL